MGGFWRHLVGDSQLRWVGPEKGVLHMATGAVVNAAWDLWAKIEEKPLWKLLADMSPEEIVRLIDWRHMTDALGPEEALDMLKDAQSGKAEREAQMLAHGYPAYTTSAGWLGYPDDLMRKLCREAMAEGMTHMKMKVGRDLEDDLRRAAIMREEMGDDLTLMMDANQVWEVDQAIAHMKELAPFNPWWIEEPTSPDDILGHKKIKEAIAPIGVATGEMCHNRIMFKQFLQSGAIDFCQIDSCRMGGVNEVIAVQLMAHKFNVPVCPHAGGVGLCEYVQHLAMFDFISISGSLENRIIEYVDHLHEHFLDPVIMNDGNYMPPKLPGYSITMKPETLDAYTFPTGRIWQA
jgi:L-fuconate dehydratase